MNTVYLSLLESVLLYLDSVFGITEIENIFDYISMLIGHAINILVLQSEEKKIYKLIFRIYSSNINVWGLILVAESFKRLRFILRVSII